MSLSPVDLGADIRITRGVQRWGTSNREGVDLVWNGTGSLPAPAC
jgi:hypothetical protein